MTSRLICSLIAITSLTTSSAQAKPRWKAIAFDYFVLFDPNSVVREVEKVFPQKGIEFTRAWRNKQFEYGFLRSITHQHRDFFAVTGDALDYTAEAMHLELRPESRAHLLNAYLTLEPWPDTVTALRRLRAAGVRIITIANFSSKMLRANAEHAKIADLFDELLSTEVNSTYKPDAAAYALGMAHLDMRKSDIVFAAFGGWDAYGAKSFGYATCWVNRLALPPERLSVTFDHSSRDLKELVDWVLAP